MVFFCPIISLDISLIVCIALCFIPIFTKELQQTILAFSAKGINTNGIYIFKTIQYKINKNRLIFNSINIIVNS